MTDGTEERENLYKSADIATMLKIQESTLRKYCILLEEAGYDFHKNEYGHRAFVNRDVMVLNRLIEVKNAPGMTLKQACNAIVIWVNSDDVSKRDITDIAENERHSESYEVLLKEFEEFRQQQEDFNRELLNQLKRQEERLIQRDRELMEAIQEVQETRKLLAAAEEEEKKRGFFGRLFGK